MLEKQHPSPSLNSYKRVLSGVFRLLLLSRLLELRVGQPVRHPLVILSLTHYRSLRASLFDTPRHSLPSLPDQC